MDFVTTEGFHVLRTNLAFFPGKFVKRMQQQFQDRLADAGTMAEESISSIRTVRSFSGENKVSESYWTHIDKSYQVGKKLAVAGGKIRMEIEICNNVCHPRVVVWR